MIRQVWPSPRDLSGDDLEQLYRYPAHPRWLAVNFVSSADGAITVEGRSGGLSTPADRIVYRLGNDLADVVLVGAGTAMAEGFEGMRPDAATADRRRRFGLAPIAPVAVVTTGRSLPPAAPVITRAAVPTIVFTCEAAPPALREAWASNGARVFVVGAAEVPAGEVVSTLVSEGLGRIDCEGGPRLFGSLIEAGVVDEFRLTVAPFLVAGRADRAAVGPAIDPAELRLASVLTDGASVLLRYLAGGTEDDRGA
ncbi:dihydrofolate reductase family protein [Amycolatopsis sp. NPDC049688]|uniref:dihydrofolate reductase family protein n=1 Tax=Amycolatopsis sp. NPDC049688 TaxID=3154733 RepID=UPI003418B859